MRWTVLMAMPGPVLSTVLILTAVVAIYSVAKALMRYIDNHKKDKQ